MEKNYYEFFENIPAVKLQKMRKFEFIFILFGFLEIFACIFIFYLIHFRGVNSFQPRVEIDYVNWHSSITIAYYLSWLLIGLCVLTIFLRIQYRKLAKIPPIKQDHLTDKQIYGDEKFIAKNTPIVITKKKKILKETVTQKDEQIKSNENSQIYNINGKENSSGLNSSDEVDPLPSLVLRDYRVNYLVNFLIVCVIIGHLNYYPRAERLFPSFTMISDEIGIVLYAVEFTTFFMINILFQFMISVLFLFIILFAFRQLKDISLTLKKTILIETEQNNGKINNDEWKPTPPKPWKMMSITERRDYQMNVIQIQKSRAKKIEREKLRKMITEEKEKIKYGKKFVKEKQKQKRNEAKQLQIKQKEKKEKEERKKQYDFR